jgi:hypothetical protein
MADFAELTLAETAAKAKIRQALMRKLKDNCTNLNARISQSEQSAHVFEHFNAYSFDAVYPLFEKVNLYDIVAGIWSVYQAGDATGGYGGVFSRRTVRIDAVTSPVRLKARCKKISDVSHLLGLRLQSAATLSDTQGVWLERVDASNWRFVSYDTARNNGVNFTKPTDGTWFEVDIEWTSATSVSCRVDGVLKDTLITQLPSNDLLRVHLLSAGTGGAWTKTMEIDRFEFSFGALTDAA